MATTEYHSLKKLLHSYYNSGNFDLAFSQSTTATFGSISTQHFGEKFDKEKLDGSFKFDLGLHIPPSAQSNPNITLIFEVEKVSLKHLSKGKEFFYFDLKKIDSDIGMFSQNFTKPYNSINRIDVVLERSIPEIEARRIRMNLMPGFNITWYYNGGEVEPYAEYYDMFFLSMITREFVRNAFVIII